MRKLARRPHQPPAWLQVSVIALVVGACALPGSSSAETVGEHFRRVIAQIDAQCKKEKKGPYLDPSDPEYKSKRRETQCDILKLKPYDPLATPEGRFAHSIKLPSPYDKPKDVYKAGMTGEEYFKALCDAEAGQWVFKIVHGVDGVFQARTPPKYPPAYVDLVFFAAEKGEMNIRKPQDALVQPYQGRYNFLELPNKESKGENKTYLRYFRIADEQSRKLFQTSKDGRFVKIPYVVAEERTDKLAAKYGYVWRGIQPYQGPEYGIEGSELIIFSLATKDALAFRRYFNRYVPVPQYKDQRYMAVTKCPKSFSNPPFRFIESVLIPSDASYRTGER